MHISMTPGHWECDRGYEKLQYGCTAVRIPSHAYATYEPGGRGWRCQRGYKQFGDSCIVIHIPNMLFSETAVMSGNVNEAS